MDFDTVWERIKSNTDLRTFIDLATAVNVQQSAISKRRKRGLGEFPAEWIFILADKYGLTADFFAYGRYPKYRSAEEPDHQENQLSHKTTGAGSSDLGPEWTRVPQYKARLSAGPGSFIKNGDGENIGSFTFKTAWLNRKCQPNECGCFRVSGDSMAPVIQDGDVVLVDMAQNDLRELREGKIYAFSEGELIRIKRLIYKGSGELWAISDNKQTSPDSPIDMATFSLIGRVIWVGHEVW